MANIFDSNYRWSEESRPEGWLSEEAKDQWELAAPDLVSELRSALEGKGSLIVDLWPIIPSKDNRELQNYREARKEESDHWQQVLKEAGIKLSLRSPFYDESGKRIEWSPEDGLNEPQAVDGGADARPVSERCQRILPNVGSEENASGTPFNVGDPVLVCGGYERDPEWLQGGSGYYWTIRGLRGKYAIVELDSPLNLPSIVRKDPAWRIWGQKTDDPDRINTPRGKWLLLVQGWVGSRWNEPTDRLHVVLCDEDPTTEAAEENKIYGAWIESHAQMCHVPPT